jgi:putative pyruvate formate lyase activating enzyme
MKHNPSFLFLSPQEWDKRIGKADLIASTCALCPRRCGVNRLKGETGFCGAPGELFISSIFPHHGEEPPISGKNGSGTVFFSYCTLKCCFCQNHQISHEAVGERYSTTRLAEKLLELQIQGCHNVNLVTATHFLPWVLRALKEAASRGLCIPLVYNNGGYELPEVLGLLRGIVDIYLPDMKYGESGAADLYSKAPNYVEINKAAIVEMFRQVGPLCLDAGDIAYKGLCIRHLVLPGKLAGSEKIFKFLETTFDPQDIFVSLMAQYRPLYKAEDFSEISKSITEEEYDYVKGLMVKADLNGFYQELLRINMDYCIDFKTRKNEPLVGKGP